MQRPHRKKARLASLEPIAGPWLRAAMEARGLSVVQVQRQLEACKVTVARQTLSYVLAGQQRTVRADVRRALAAVLRVTEGFLAGAPQGAGAWARTLEGQPWSPVVAFSISNAHHAWRSLTEGVLYAFRRQQTVRRPADLPE